MSVPVRQGSRALRWAHPQAMHCNIIRNLLQILNLPHEHFDAAHLDIGLARKQFGMSLVAGSASEGEQVEAGKVAITAVVYAMVIISAVLFVHSDPNSL